MPSADPDNDLKSLAIPAGLEPATLCLEGKEAGCEVSGKGSAQENQERQRQVISSKQVTSSNRLLFVRTCPSRSKPRTKKEPGDGSRL